jgi:hypothetical protein
MDKFKELSFEEKSEMNGGYFFSFGSTSWSSSFWKGAGVGIGVGATGAAAYYALA